MASTEFDRPDHEVTAQDKRALRSADTVTFHLHEGRSRITAHRDGRNSASGFDERHDIACNTRLLHYDRDAAARHDKTAQAYTGYVWMPYVKYTDHDEREWATMRDAIAAGSTLTLRWTMGNDNECNREVGWRRDELRLVVSTPTKAGKPKVRTYLVAIAVGPINSASMMGCNA